MSFTVAMIPPPFMSRIRSGAAGSRLPFFVGYMFNAAPDAGDAQVTGNTQVKRSDQPFFSRVGDLLRNLQTASDARNRVVVGLERENRRLWFQHFSSTSVSRRAFVTRSLCAISISLSSSLNFTLSM